MKPTKPKRPRKPAQPIKVAGNTKTRLSGESGSQKPVDARIGSFERVGDKIAFVDDANGRWRLIDAPSLNNI